MFKQILSSLPRKSSKTSESRDHGGNHATYSSIYGGSRSSDLGTDKTGNLSVSYSPALNSSADGGWKSSNMKPSENDNVFSGYEALPAFKDVPASEKHNLFIIKTHFCCIVFDFNDPTKNLKEKEIKRKTLFELVEYVTSANGKFSEVVLQEIVKNFRVNTELCFSLVKVDVHA